MRSRLVILPVVLALASRAVPAAAAGPDDLRARLEAAERERDHCQSTLGDVKEQLGDAEAAHKASRAAREHACTQTVKLVEDLARGQPTNAWELSCLTADQQRRLATVLGSWSVASTTLGQLGAYASGEVDVLPSNMRHGTPLDRMVQRLAGGATGAPIVYRRLLVDAMRLIAPRAWEAVRAGGATALDAWFTSSTPLDDAIEEEARHTSRNASANATGGPLSTAARLVRAYQIVADCVGEEGTAAKHDACLRARQLQQLVETTGPLLVERRKQDIWATPCEEVSKERVLEWVAD